ncbi:MAG: DASS family sodium-coupled anion symporter [Candidatus Omnitrophica bacterium]|nr:DASS family sodium-coupled anion symporter [Candidatus Omnitrophota bacterium]
MMILAVLLAFAAYFLLPADCPEPARRAAGIFIIAAIFWACEVIPLFATSLVVIVLEILLLSGPGLKTYTSFLTPLANPVIMLFLGGFVIARAFHKHRVDEWLAYHLIGGTRRSAYSLLLGFMGVTAFLSMWLSNTATAALIFALIRPFLDKLSPTDPYRKSLVFGVALAASFGGIATPVGTPPNAIAIALLAKHGYVIHFFDWMKMALPLTVLLILVTSVILSWCFRSENLSLSFDRETAPPFTMQAKGVLLIAVTTVLLWLTAAWHGIPEAAVALAAVAALGAFRYVEPSDMRRIEWDVLILMWGGLALGAGIESTGLAGWLIGLPIFASQGIVLAFTLVAVTVFTSTFMSNTATVNLLIPIVLSLPGEAKYALAILIAISSSLDFPLPMATPPMAMAYATGELKVSEMLRAGFLVTLAANAILFVGVFIFARRFF